MINYWRKLSILMNKEESSWTNEKDETTPHVYKYSPWLSVAGSLYIPWLHIYYPKHHLLYTHSSEQHCFFCIFWINLEHVFEQNCCAFHTLSMPLLLPNSGAIYVTLLLCVLQCAFCLPIKTFEWHDTPFFPVYRYLCYLYHIYFFLSVRHINIYKHLYRMIIYKLHLMIFFEKIN